MLLIPMANSDVMENANLAGSQEGATSFSIGVDFVYKIDFKGTLTYENRYNRNPIKDRDTIALTLSYNF